MKRLERRDILKKGQFARFVVASAFALAASDDDEGPSNVPAILSRANSFGTLSSILVKRSRNIEARTTEHREFLTRMGKWMVETPGQTYMKRFVVPLLQSEDDLDKNEAALTALFPWMREAQPADDEDMRRRLADEFLDLGDSPIVDYMVSLKLRDVDDVNALNVLPVTYLEDYDVKLAHHNFLIDFFFDMLPNLLVNTSPFDTRYDDISSTIDMMYKDYNTLVHAIAKALLEVFKTLALVVADDNKSKVEKYLNDIIKSITSVDPSKPTSGSQSIDIDEYFERQESLTLTTILRSVSDVLGVQICASIIYHLKFFSDANSKVREVFSSTHLEHTTKWLLALYPKYVVRDDVSLMKNPNLAEHDSAMAMLSTLMSALENKNVMIKRYQDAAKAKK